MNGLELPPHYTAGQHFHDEQEELYFVHRGEVEIDFGDGTTQRSARAGWRAWTPRPCASWATPATSRRVLLIAGGKDGVRRAATADCPEGEESPRRTLGR